MKKSICRKESASDRIMKRQVSRWHRFVGYLLKMIPVSFRRKIADSRNERDIKELYDDLEPVHKIQHRRWLADQLRERAKVTHPQEDVFSNPFSQLSDIVTDNVKDA